MKLNVRINADDDVLVEEVDNHFLIEKIKKEFDVISVSPSKYLAHFENKAYVILVTEKKKDELILNINGHDLTISSQDEIALLLDKLGMEVSGSTETTEILAPMPGLILSINIKEGEELSEGDAVLVLEAMKMENLIKSPIEAKALKIHVTQGENVEKNQLLVSF